MRAILVAALLAGLLPMAAAAAAPLQIVRPIVSEMEGGVADPPGYEYAPGQTLFFACRIANYAKTSEMKIHLAYSVQAFDSRNVPLVELYKNEISDELALEDKEWLPKIATSIAIPPLIYSGAYHIVVKVEDLVGKTNTELSVPFRVRGRDIAPSDTLVVRAFRFYRDENGTQPADKPAYRVGDGLWARFYITGFKYGPQNKVDVSYRISIVWPGGKWEQPEPAVEHSESFYPKRYVAASFGIPLTSVHPAKYTMLVTVKDAIGNQTCESTQPFTVE